MWISPQFLKIIHEKNLARYLSPSSSHSGTNYQTLFGTFKMAFGIGDLIHKAETETEM